MTVTRLLSSDTHIIEPPDLWTSRIAAQFRDRAPHVVTDGDTEWWIVDGHRTLSFAGGAQTGDRFERPRDLRTGARFTQVRPGGYQPHEHLADNEQDGVYGSVLYPTEGLLVYTVADGPLLSAACRAYNDWLAEFCRAAPGRLKGVAMLNCDDVDEAVTELARTRDLGLAGAMIPTAAPPERPYSSPDYDRLWAAACDLQVPLSLHLGANRRGAGGVESDLAAIRPSYFTVCEHSVKVSLADLIFAGVFDRFPSLRVGTVEHELGWIPFFLDRLDYTYTQRQGNSRYYRYRTAEVPSDFFARNIFASFQDDDLGVRERHRIGIDSLCWGSDYPHTESTFPRSREIMSARLADVPQGEQDQIVFGNAARLYGFSLDLVATAAR
jgi:predicted TIM-barrel fold metal-dependent hydrolase